LAHIEGVFYNACTKVKRREHLSEEAKHLRPHGRYRECHDRLFFAQIQLRRHGFIVTHMLCML